MRIAFVGKISIPILKDYGRWDRDLPHEAWGFPLGGMIVRGLLERGHEVHVISTESYLIEGCYKCTVGDETAPRLIVHFVPESKKTCWMYLRFFAYEINSIRKVLSKISPDVVFAQWTYENAYAGLTSGFPTLVVAHDSPWRIFLIERGLKSLIKAIFAQMLVFPRLTFLTTVSPYIVNELRVFNRYDKSVDVIPNGMIIPDEIQRTPSREQAKTIAVVSAWSALKNVKTFFRAWSALKKRRPHWRAVVFGRGLDENVAGKWAREHSVSLDGLELRGMQPRSEIDKFLSEEADVFCSPSLEESFGMVFVEAMIRGVPCVGGKKSGAVPWVMGEGGVTCDVTKPEKLAECLENLMLDYRKRKLMSEAGVERVRKVFDLKTVVGAYEKKLMEVVQCEKSKH